MIIRPYIRWPSFTLSIARFIVFIKAWERGGSLSGFSKEIGGGSFISAALGD